MPNPPNITYTIIDGLRFHFTNVEISFYIDKIMDRLNRSLFLVDMDDPNCVDIMIQNGSIRQAIQRFETMRDHLDGAVYLLSLDEMRSLEIVDAPEHRHYPGLALSTTTENQ